MKQSLKNFFIGTTICAGIDLVGHVTHVDTKITEATAKWVFQNPNGMQTVASLDQFLKTHNISDQPLQSWTARLAKHLD